MPMLSLLLSVLLRFLLRVFPIIVVALWVPFQAHGMSQPPPPPPTGGLAQPGPGLGNLSYTRSELFKPIAWITRKNGVPPTYPLRKDFGINTAIMMDGYFLTLFAPDSGAGPGGFLLYDISNPREIKLVKRIYEPDARTKDFREAHAIGVTRIKGQRYISIQTTKGIEIWNFTDLNQITQTAKLALPGVNGGDYDSVAWQLWWQAPYLYVSVANQGIYIVDTKDPANPIIADRGNGLPNPVPPQELGGFRVGPIFTLGNQMIISSMDQKEGIASLDISDPLNPVLLDRITGLNTKFYATCFDGKQLHLSVRGGGARMISYDVSNPSRLRRISKQVRVDEQLYCATQDEFVYQGAQERVHKINVHNEPNYLDVGSGTLAVSHADHGQVSPLGNVLFIGNDHGTGSAFMVHTPFPDTRPPSVLQVSPRHESTSQALTSRIGIAFSDSVDFESLNATHVQLTAITDQGEIHVPVTISAQLGLVNLSPNEPLTANTRYRVRVKNIKDLAGNAMTQGFESTFTTGQGLKHSAMHHWPMDHDLKDIARSNNGTLIAPLFKQGAIHLAGDSITLENDVTDVLGQSASLSFYLKTIQSGGQQPWLSPGVFGADQRGGDNDVFWGWLDHLGHLNVSAGNQTGARTPTPVNDGLWHHFVLTRHADTGTYQIWQDGHHVAQGQGRSGAIKPQWNNRITQLGAIQGGRALYAALDDVKLFNRVLSDDDIRSLSATPVVNLPNALTHPALVNEAVVFNANIKSSDAYSVHWDFGDGTQSHTSSSSYAEHTYRQPGHYQVVVTITSREGTQIHHITKLVHQPLTDQTPSHSLPITGHGKRVYIANADNASVTAVDTQTTKVLWETRVGKTPRTIARTDRGLLWVTLQDDDALVALTEQGTEHMRVQLAHGSGPYGIALSADGSMAAVSLQHKGELLLFNPHTGRIQQRIAVNDDPRGVAIDASGNYAYVTRMRTAMTAHHSEGAEVTQVNLRTAQVQQRLRLAPDTTTQDGEDRSRGVPNYLHQVVLSPDGRRAWLPTTKVNIARGMFRDGQALGHDTTVRTVINQIDVTTGQEMASTQLDFNDRDSARAVLLSPKGDYAFVALQGSNSVEIVDAYSGTIKGAINPTGLAPQGLWLDEQQHLHVYNFTSRTLSSFDVSDVLASRQFAPPRIASVSLVGNEALSREQLKGKQIFYNAKDNRMSRDGYMSCASCHVDGMDDGVVWDFTDRGEGLRNTISLIGRAGTGHGRLHWTANFDEIHDFENDIRHAFGGRGFMTDADFALTEAPLGTGKAGKSVALDALVAYVESLSEFERSPERTSSGELTAQALAGKALFDNQGCESCHSGHNLQDNQRHDVGSLQPNSGQGSHLPLANVGLDTPTLRGVWRTPPYFHNGQMATLDDVLHSGHGLNRTLNDAEIQQLVAYLKSLQ